MEMILFIIGFLTGVISVYLIIHWNLYKEIKKYLNMLKAPKTHIKSGNENKNQLGKGDAYTNAQRKRVSKANNTTRGVTNKKEEAPTDILEDSSNQNSKHSTAKIQQASSSDLINKPKDTDKTDYVKGSRKTGVLLGNDELEKESQQIDDEKAIDDPLAQKTLQQVEINSSVRLGAYRKSRISK